MALYPSLEDMKVGQMAQTQAQYEHAAQQPQTEYPGQAALTFPAGAPGGSSLYPSLQEYMGLSLTPEMIQQNMPLVAQHPMQVAQPTSGQLSTLPAPVSGAMDVGIRRAEVKQGVREVILCKDQSGKVGLRARGVNKGVFVGFVFENSPAAMAGLRFGDQVLQINGENCAGWDTDKVHKCLKKAAAEKIVMAIRDRPFERTITLQKDSAGYIGFVFKNGKVTQIVKDSSAARNGMLIDHQLCEVGGQNVVGVKDKEIGEIINSCGRTVTVTIMPTFIYDHMMKNIGSSLVKKHMDHSIPDV